MGRTEEHHERGEMSFDYRLSKVLEKSVSTEFVSLESVLILRFLRILCLLLGGSSFSVCFFFFGDIPSRYA